MATTQTVASKLANLLPLLKEASVQAQTNMGILASQKPEDVDKLRGEIDHMYARMAGTVERNEGCQVAEILVDSFKAMLELDVMWRIDEEGQVLFVDEGLLLKLKDKELAIFATTSATARAQFFTLRTLCAIDTGRTMFIALLNTMLASTVELHRQYCEVLHEHVSKSPF